jgi:phi LC3 family holin
MNLKVRLKNVTFWITFLPMCVSFIYQVLSLFNIVPKISENDVINVITTIITFLGNIGVLIDPTTKGITDSRQAMTYETPKEG